MPPALPRLTRAECTLGVLFLLTLPLVNPYIRGEGNAHYAYLTSLILDYDLQFEDEFRRGDADFVTSTFRSADGHLRPRLQMPDGRARNQWAVGPALLWAPSFLQAHAAALALRAAGAPLAVDGYSVGYRVVARFVPYDPPRQVPIVNVLGQVNPMPSPGYVAFEMGGREVRLDPVLEEADAKELFLIFRDATAGRETYPAGRFLYSELPRDGRVVLDFNKAYSPPCAFTDFATCPLPPKQNRLAVRVPAGEKRPRGHPAK